ncbi:hypothetical protein GB927_025455 [Shinella sp. CPCC 100929]|jgi:hypothetical protein|uniref:Uncharacterized protein n=1 Tax=Shinella lacus TaxID=2654216 RepID=A0ABT1RDZ1_9HYPH|nr:hypothetical protein [Shinella lacus]MCQ4633412.1 hypothetical protein [Shinella lacus]
MTDPIHDKDRTHTVRRKNWLMLFVLLGFVVFVTAYSALHIRSEVNTSAVPAGATETGK